MITIPIPTQMYDEFKRVLTVLQSVKHFDQYHPAKKYSRLFFSKWEWLIKEDKALYMKMHTEVLVQCKSTLRSIRTEPVTA